MGNNHLTKRLPLVCLSLKQTPTNSLYNFKKQFSKTSTKNKKQKTKNKNHKKRRKTQISITYTYT